MERHWGGFAAGLPAMGGGALGLLGGRVYAWEDGYQPGPNQAEPGLCEYDGGHI